MAKRCRQLCIVLFVTVWFIIAEGKFLQVGACRVYCRRNQKKADFAEDMDEALTELDLSVWSSLIF